MNTTEQDNRISRFGHQKSSEMILESIHTIGSKDRIIGWQTIRKLICPDCANGAISYRVDSSKISTVNRMYITSLYLHVERDVRRRDCKNCNAGIFLDQMYKELKTYYFPGDGVLNDRDLEILEIYMSIIRD